MASIRTIAELSRCHHRTITIAVCFEHSSYQRFEDIAFIPVRIWRILLHLELNDRNFSLDDSTFESHGLASCASLLIATLTSIAALFDSRFNSDLNEIDKVGRKERSDTMSKDGCNAKTLGEEEMWEMCSLRLTTKTTHSLELFRKLRSKLSDGISNWTLIYRCPEWQLSALSLASVWWSNSQAVAFFNRRVLSRL